MGEEDDLIVFHLRFVVVATAAVAVVALVIIVAVILVGYLLEVGVVEYRFVVSILGLLC